MKPYDPNKRYLGPNDHWLTEHIPEAPENSPPELKEDWNKEAYKHDVAYEGDEYAGFWGWLKKWANRVEAERDRSKADREFGDALILAVERHKHLMTMNERIEAFAYARTVYESVNNFGWAFYRNQKNKRGIAYAAIILVMLNPIYNNGLHDI